MAQLLLASSSLTAAAPASLTEALARVEARLDAWAANSTAYNNLLLQVFAGAGNEPAFWQQAAAALQSTLQASGLAIRLELLGNAELPGINGAYTAQAPGGGERIYLNSAWLRSASAEQIEAVLLEELGHAIDRRLNGANDSPGDEGERFSALLRGLVPTAASFTENDQRLITLLGQPLLVEAADTTAPRLDLTGFRNPAFAGAESAFGLPDVGSFASPAFADIDGDGDLDAFIGQRYGATLFFRNTGNATAPAFAGSASAFGLPVGNNSVGATVVDLDGDGIPDITILRRFGDSAAPAFVDIDGDGDLDAAIGEFFGTTLFFRNTGSATAPAFAGSFSAFADVGSLASPTFADIDGDGDLDAFIGNKDGNTLFFRNTGSANSPAFAGSSIGFGFPDVSTDASPSFADIDGDGDLDAFIGERYGRTFFVRNTGNATAPAFASAASVSGLPDVGDSLNPASPTFADIDGDGDLDAFIGTRDGITLFFRNTGSGGVSSSNPDGIYGQGSVITIEVPFSEVVFVTGSPRLLLETGSTDRFATFAGGSGTRVLTFTYTVQAGDASADLDLSSSSALQLNGGTIRDAAGNNAVLTLPAPGSTSSLGANAALVIDGVAPQVDLLSDFRNPAFVGTGIGAFRFPDVGTVASPALADIDGDGDLDVFIGTGRGSTLFFRNTGSATAPALAAATTNPFGLTEVGFFSRLTIADIDGDGDLDAFITSREGSTFFFRNTGSTTAPAFAGSAGAFGLPNGGVFASPAFADIDGDGDLDAFVGNVDGNTLFFRNTGNATAPIFAAAAANPFGLADVGRYASPSFVDFDGDGDLDAFIGERYGNTLFLRNTGSATSPAFADSSIGFGLPVVGTFAIPALFDIDGDGDLDAFIGNNQGNTLFFRNIGGGGLSSANPNGSYGIGDEITLTIRFSEAVFVDTTNGIPTLRLAAGSSDRFATFSGGSGTRVLTFTLTVQAGDSSADLDLLSANALELNGATIRDAVDNDAVLTLPVPGTAGSLRATVDLVIDGVVPRVDLSGFRNPAFAGSSIAFGLPVVGANARPSFVDIDGDGDLDAFIGNQAGSTLFFRNTGNATAPAFAASTSAFGLPNVGSFARPAFADIDGDGDLDAFIGSGSGNTLFFRNTGNAVAPAFAGSTSVFGSTAVTVRAIPALVDIDGDGDLDAFVGELYGRTLFFRNTGSATSPAFAGSSIAFNLPGVGLSASPAFADIDGDGDLDAFIGELYGRTLFFRNTSSGTNPAFAGSSIGFGFPDVGLSASPAFADIDGDGDLDAFIGNNVGTTLFFRNTGSGGITSPNPNGTYGIGSVITIEVPFSEVVFVNTAGGTPTLLLETGSTDRVATYLSGSGTRVLSFSYTVQAGDSSADLDVTSSNALALNGATIRDAAGNDADLTLPAPGTPGSLAANSALVIDGVAPTASIVVTDTALAAGETSLVTITFSEAVTGFTNDDLTIENGTLSSVSSADGGLTYTATFTPTAGLTAASNTISLNNSGVSDFVGNPGTGLTTSNAYAIDTATPTITAVASSTPDGAYGIGSVITITVRFSEAVTVNTGGGTPTLALETGSIDRLASYLSGSGTDTLTFSYTVQPGDSSDDLDLLSANALDLNGGSIRDTAGNDADLTLIAPGTPGSLADSAALLIDGIAPVAFTTLPAFVAETNPSFGLPNVGGFARPTFVDIDGDGDLDAFIGEYFGNTLFFRNTAAPGASEPAFAAETTNPFGLTDVSYFARPSFVDIDGDGDLDAFIGNNYGNILFFRNDAAPGASDPAFTTASTNPFGLTNVGYVANPSFVDIDGDGDLDAFIGERDGNTLFFRNNAAPGATAPVFAAETTTNFGLANVGSFASPGFVDIDDDGDLDAFIGNNVGNVLFFRNDAAPGASAPAFVADNTNFGIGNVGSFANPSFVDIDGDGDLDLFIGNRNGNTLFFRKAAPLLGVSTTTLAGTYGIGSVITLTVRFSEAVIVNTAGGTPTLALETGAVDRFASFTGGSGTSVLTFTYIVQAGDTSADLDLLSTAALVLNGATIRDAAGNDAVLNLAAPGATGSLGANAALVIDGVAPTASIVVTDNALAAGETSLVTITFSEAVIGFTNDDLTIENGTLSSVSSADGGLTYTATFTPTAGLTAASNTISLNNSGVSDTAGNPATGSTTSNDYAIDTATPTITAVASSTPDGAYAIGALITLTIRFSEAVTVNTGGGTPTLALETGTVDRFASFSGGSGSDTLTFTYTVQAGDSSGDLDQLSANALELNGATIRDTAGNDAVLTLPAPGTPGSLAANAALVIDGIGPTITAGPFAVGDASIAIRSDANGSVALFTDDNTRLFRTALRANTLGTFNLAAQAAITRATLKVADIAGNLTAAIPSFLLGTTANDTLTGTATADLLYGFAGNDTLNGAAGIDTLTGGDGNDTYSIETNGDLVVETNTNAATGGIDTVRSSLAAYTLTTNVENLILTGAATINGTGNALNNSITGNGAANSLTGAAGNDTLNGGAGIDTLTGGDGSDTYSIETVGDLVVETNAVAATGGTDTVLSSLAAYTLTANIEHLTLTGAASINGTGNALNNRITGNAAANVLNGGAGIDTLTGGDGNDAYVIETIGDLIIETNANAATGGTDRVVTSLASYTLTDNVENLTLAGAASNGTGNALNNTIAGNASANSLDGAGGNDSLIGGAGIDTLTGGLGSDTFRFDSPLNAVTNRDLITDFTLAQSDVIELENSVFTTLTTTGTLAASAFTTGASATSAAHRILYNTNTGLLAFDSDGNGAAAAIAFATLSPGLALSNASFTVT